MGNNEFNVCENIVGIFLCNKTLNWLFLILFWYYYANFSTKLVKRNWKLHDPDSPLLIGDVKDSDVVKEILEPSNWYSTKIHSI